MSGDHWFLGVGCWTLIVRYRSVLRHYPGGEFAFEHTYKPQRRCHAHYQVIAFSQAEVDTLLDRLAASGLALGEDVALASQFAKPLVHCPEVGFWRHPGLSGSVRWKVGAVRVPLASYPVEGGPIPIARTGRVAPLHELGDAGLVIATREIDADYGSRDEYLCAFAGPEGFELDVLRYRWLGEVPDDWFDDHGVPLPDLVDHNGNIRAPETFAGQPVVAFRYEGFIGEFVSVSSEGPAWLTDSATATLYVALEHLGWPREALGDLELALEHLGAINDYRRLSSIDTGGLP